MGGTKIDGWYPFFATFNLLVSRTFYYLLPWWSDGGVVPTTGKVTRLTRVSGGAEESGFKKFVKIYAEELKETFRRR